MKKIIAGFLAVLVLIIAATYFFIPSVIQISAYTITNSIPKNIASCLNTQAAWKDWWPHDDNVDTAFTRRRFSFQLVEPYTDGASIAINRKNRQITSKITLLPIGKDSIEILWEANVSTGMNPISRISGWLRARSLQESMDIIIKSMADFATDTKNIYGFSIKRTTFTDTTLLAMKASSKNYPGNDLIYRHIDSLRSYIASQGAKEVDPPMLNVKPIDSIRYEFMVAIPIDKRLPASGNMFMSLMVPMEGRFLETKATGGPATLKKAHEAVGRFMSDRLLTPPAIPFEILVTDRRSEHDTTKWMTKIFNPTM